MTTGTKPSVVGRFLVMAVLVAAGLWFVGNLGKTGSKDDGGGEQVYVRVDFTPTKRSQVVTVDVAVNGVTIIHDSATTSPWKRSFEVSPGDQVQVITAQQEPDTLQCSIERTGGRATLRNRTGPGPVICFS